MSTCVNPAHYQMDCDSESYKESLIDRKSCWSELCQRIPARYVFTLLGFFGFFNVYALRVNLSVAIVSMVNATVRSTNTTPNSDCPAIHAYNSSSGNVEKEGEFQWDEYNQGIVLGSFFYGYIISQIPGGRLAEVVGGKWLFGGGILLTSVLTLLTPLAARFHIGALILVRVLMGLGEGPTFPAMHSMLAKWIPKTERTFLTTLVYCGSQIGSVVALPITGFLCGSDFLGGWPSCFYVFGTLGCIWSVFWLCLTSNHPTDHPRITTAELLYIQVNQESSNKKIQSVPWKAILTSVPVWALVFTHFGHNWGFYILFNDLPSYMNNILHYNIKENGVVSSLPYLFMAVFSWCGSYSADLLRRKNYLRITIIRKICNTIGFVGPALCLFGVIMVGCNHIISSVLFALSMGFNGFISAGFIVCHMDLAPDFAGTLMGITNAFGNISGFLAPYFVGVLTQENETLYRWTLVFSSSIGFYIVTNLLFVVFGSAELQHWGVASNPENKEMDKIPSSATN